MLTRRLNASDFCNVGVYAGGVFGVIHEFYIDPEIRSDGLGNQLIEKVKKQQSIWDEKGWRLERRPIPNGKGQKVSTSEKVLLKLAID